MNQTKKMMTGVLAAMMVTSMVGCGSNSAERPLEPEDDECDNWKFDEETGTYYCDDSHSSRAGFFYFGGRYFKNKNALKSDSSFKSYQSQYKSGIGSGTKGGFGG
ncbi:hypothetical protein [Metabacillus iocasae]|uniref:Uncharacterized lipoprotein YehR (DUF1307 family) n=1 Tax=Priestia iocasae TaxID=2291674 RepID=A0ABS2QY56_9BACI|nr:hypothetical protein [Metabacillus iocasae]MBM7703872.1 uncharacterized lipoprotein YehR (DUF1307 family) [Metabacillus iocasae]